MLPVEMQLADCQAKNAVIRRENRRLRAALRLFRYEDCPECYAQSEMLADVTPLSPGSKNVMVIPTGTKMTHHDGCKLGALMATLEPCVAPDTKGQEK